MNDGPIAYFDDNGDAVFRSSALSKPACQLAYSLMGQTPSSPPERLQAAFDAGHAAEEKILRLLGERGWTLFNSAQAEVTMDWPGMRVVGHVDELGECAGYEPMPIDAKFLAASTFEQARSLGHAGLPFGYGEQMLSYMEGSGATHGCWVSGLKTLDDGEVVLSDDGTPKVGELHIEVVSMEGLKKTLKAQGVTVGGIRRKLKQAIAWAEAEEVPQGGCPETWPCSFHFLHQSKDAKKEEEMAGLEELGGKDAAKLAELGRRHLELKAIEATWKPVKDELGEIRKAIMNIVGDRDGVKGEGVAVTFTTRTNRKANYKMLEQDYPEAYEAAISTTESRTLGVEEL